MENFYFFHTSFLAFPHLFYLKMTSFLGAFPHLLLFGTTPLSIKLPNKLLNKLEIVSAMKW